ncbi:uncharacterized protein MELLADRAFT_75810 [Melampsora larici-populina 98AG31]|uniref:Uncharacterized protein n=1 Tax=Melampsora larici-populina (strain 98AG31 / pathotype 3-4-7) TaxID=747676 RepID=F4S598_MELLP|nr:uncharacterized protein MELLADRAFT_75810 [Melampsora larici-populina 98AG31]EGG00129.1 hypothetical protein MELLADRAFT_75810 [Melampsora larici-populina 98AG31]
MELRFLSARSKEMRDKDFKQAAKNSSEKISIINSNVQNTKKTKTKTKKEKEVMILFVFLCSKLYKNRGCQV